MNVAELAAPARRLVVRRTVVDDENAVAGVVGVPEALEALAGVGEAVPVEDDYGDSGVF